MVIIQEMVARAILQPELILVVTKIWSRVHINLREHNWWYSGLI